MKAAPARVLDDDGDPSLEPSLLLNFVEKRLGAAVAATILEAFSGRQVHVPTVPREHLVLCRLIGLENTEIISREFGSGNFPLPLRQFGAAARRHADVKQACRERRTTTSIVKEFQISARTVHKIRAQLRREEGFK